MKKIFFILIIIYVINFHSITIIDSLKANLDNANDKDKPLILNNIAAIYYDIDPQKTIEYADQALALSQKYNLKKQEAFALQNLGIGYSLMSEYQTALEYLEKNLSLSKENNFIYSNIDALNGIGHLYRKQSCYEKSLEHYFSALKMAEKTKKQETIVDCYNNIGIAYWTLNRYDKALGYYQKANDYYQKTNDKKGLATSFNNIGNVHYKLGNFEKAVKFYLQSLKIKEELGYQRQIAHSLNNLGAIYFKRKEYDQALDYFQRALSEYELFGDKKNIAMTLGNIGSLYSQNNDYEIAIKYHEQSLKIKEEIDDKSGIAIALNNLGIAYEKLNDQEKALEHYLSSLRIREEINERAGIAAISNNIGNLFIHQNKNKDALSYLEKSLKISKEINEKELMAKSYELLSQIYLSNKNYEKAYIYYRNSSVLNDSIYNEESSRQIAEMQIKYDSEKQEKEIEILNRDKKIQALALSKNKFMKNTFILGFIILLILGSIVFQIKQKQIKAQKKIDSETKKINKKLEARVQEELEKRLQQQQLLIQKSKLESLGKLAAGIAHEINQPLGSISMSIENIYFAYIEDQLSRKYLNGKIKNIKEYIQRIDRIIKHIKIFSRDQKSIAIDRIDVNEVIQNALSMVQTQYKNHSIKLETILGNDLGFTKGNKFKLEQVIINLLSNAKDALEEKECKKSNVEFNKKIMIETFSEIDKILIKIEDNGIGIPQENLDNIFDPFFTTKDPEKGTGLGLSIIYGILEEMKGEIRVDSKYNEYTIMKIELPKI
ncbi:MAG: tetratricopeptide repeat protein [Candidatus Cloacimonetes bacterium]|nr:tetratricopeptide repeat protein [Candidatus Cloacimonadota bacterium]